MAAFSVTEKRCWFCKQIKPFADFGPNKSKPDGKATECRECAVAIHAAYYQQNKEKISATTKSYRLRNQERYKLNARQYYKDNREKIRKRNHQRYHTKTKEILAKQHRYRTENIESFHVIERERYWKRRDVFCQRARDYYETHKQKWQAISGLKRAVKYSAPGTFTVEQLLDKFSYHGWRCYLCKTPLTPKSAHTDHRKPFSRGGSNWLANIAPTCQSCNQRKYTKSEKEFRRP